MDHKKDIFAGMTLFCAVVNHSSFSGAARSLGHTPSHVSKEIARLEDRLGTRLLNRTTRKISLTQSGRIYFENAQGIVKDAARINEQIKTQGIRPFGELKMSVPLIFAQAHFNGWLPDFLTAYPDITLNIDVSDRKVDLIAEAYDLLVRIGPLPHSGLIARELGKTAQVTVASPCYLAEHGTPGAPGELSHHKTIVFDTHTSMFTWSFVKPNGAIVSVALEPTVRCNDAGMEASLARHHRGITRLPLMSCQKLIDDGDLVRILADYESEPAGIYAIYPSRDHLPPKTRIMIDYLVKKSSTLKSP